MKNIQIAESLSNKELFERYISEASDDQCYDQSYVDALYRELRCRLERCGFFNAEYIDDLYFLKKYEIKFLKSKFVNFSEIGIADISGIINEDYLTNKDIYDQNKVLYRIMDEMQKNKITKIKLQNENN